eukprot:CAMPEP_0206269824 /NCGR_PEP_ID=MMETSP0047_2-20121206/32518_1 /ASSEMBLY_ACC=CAM_ASM_000192 /TAXON_ID=195065 /ORGANISM="Chroomonas mesostigmatica_cf, Strain CCMP1168" /LENGTH=80 /DNA_ID=CAMNT_0053698379 /DNA_START=233 /DNA_END=475 /DNA_ORIENTATION=+
MSPALTLVPDGTEDRFSLDQREFLDNIVSVMIQQAHKITPDSPSAEIKFKSCNTRAATMRAAHYPVAGQDGKFLHSSIKA